MILDKSTEGIKAEWRRISDTQIASLVAISVLKLFDCEVNSRNYTAICNAYGLDIWDKTTPDVFAEIKTITDDEAINIAISNEVDLKASRIIVDAKRMAALTAEVVALKKEGVVKP